MAAGMGSRLKGIGIGLMLFFSSFFGIFVFGGVWLLVFFVKPVLYRQLYDHIIGTWMWMAAGMLEMWIGLNVKVYGDEMRANEPSIIIMNHRTRLDWMYFWCALARQPSGIMTEKIVLKAPLKHVPGPGWAMQAAAFLFVRRRWEDDQQYLLTMLTYFNVIRYTPQFLIFPEGTDYNPETRARSDHFAIKTGLRSYENVLQPRTTGFVFLVNHIKKHWPNAAVYDVTLAYSGTFPQGEAELVSGILPESAHFLVRRYTIADDIPESEADIERWLRSRWDEKDDRLQQFSDAGGRFIGDDASSTSQSGGISDWIHVYYRLSIAFWLAFIVLFVVALMSCTPLLWLVLFTFLFYLFMGSRYDGFELFQAVYTGRKESSQPNKSN